jgi:glutamate dehydrogenase/leucine dehydrogenase
MLSQLKTFEQQAPELTLHWQDRETEAQGWLVINSLRNGAAGGGTRMRPGCNLEEVIALAKTMEVKFRVCGPPIGGAKSGIDFDPSDPRKAGVLTRWYAAIHPYLKRCYGTGGDLNVDEVAEVMPLTRQLGLSHPQEGVVEGWRKPNEADKSLIFKQLEEGVAKRVTHWDYAPTTEERHISVSDMITGFGVATAVQHGYRLWERPARAKRVIVQGFGNVGGAAALTLARNGYRIVGILDRRGGILSEEGLDLEDIKRLYLAREDNQLPLRHIRSFAEVEAQLWSWGAEVFIPAAGSRLVTQRQVEQMLGQGLELISCGANVPFADPDIFLGPTGLYADTHAAVIPDFIANCGMARTFAYLMQPGVSIEDEALFSDISATIASALAKTRERQADFSGWWQASLGWALDELGS